MTAAAMEQPTKTLLTVRLSDFERLSKLCRANVIQITFGTSPNFGRRRILGLPSVAIGRRCSAALSRQSRSL